MNAPAYRSDKELRNLNYEPDVLGAQWIFSIKYSATPTSFDTCVCSYIVGAFGMQTYIDRCRKKTTHTQQTNTRGPEEYGGLR